MIPLNLDDSRRAWLPAVLLLVLGLLVFSPVIFGGQFFWDDYELIVNSNVIHDPHGLYRIWFTTDSPDYFPLTYSFFWIEWRVFGNTPLGSVFNPYHLINVLLHCGNAILLWRLLRHLRVPGALLAAALFLVHPMNAESVSWIAEGKNALSVLLMLATTLVWIRGEESMSVWLYVGSIGLFLLALLAKTSVVMLPVVMLLVLWYRRRATPGAVLRTIPYFVLSLALGLITMWFQTHRSIQDVIVRNDSFWSRLATAGCALWFYVGKSCVPVGISFSYARWDVMRAGALAFLPVVLFAALLVVLWLLRKRIGRGYVAATAAYVALLLPVLGFVNIYLMRYSMVSDHLQYPAMPVFCAVAAATAVWGARRYGARGGKVLGAAAGVVILTFAIDSASIAAIFRTPESVWTDVLRHDDNSWLAHEQMGTILMERGPTRPEAFANAAVHLRRVVELRPDLLEGYAALGNADMAMGQVKEAQQLYGQAVAAPDGDRRERAIAYVDLGLADRRLGDAAGAERAFEEAVGVNPQSTYSWLNLGIARMERNDLAGAWEALEKSAAADRTFAEPLARLGEVYLRMGDVRRAREEVASALKLDPQNAAARQMAANLAHAVTSARAAKEDSPAR